MKWKRSILLSNSSGFTLLELLVAMALTTILVASIVTTVLAFRTLHETDLARLQVAHSLRGGISLMGIHIRQAGERLNSGFPAIELTDGSSGAPDTLTIRKNLLDEVPRVCTDATTTDTYVQMALASTAGCGYSDTASIYNAWETYRNNGLIDAYIYDSANNLGEWFVYSNETEDSNSPEYRRIHRQTGFWSRTYPSGSSNIYILEEWKFSVTNGVLQVQINDDTPDNVITGVTDLQVEFDLNDSSTVTSFSASDDWTTIRLIRVTLSGSSTVAGKTVSKSVVNTFYPRNVLSK